MTNSVIINYKAGTIGRLLRDLPVAILNNLITSYLIGLSSLIENDAERAIGNAQIVIVIILLFTFSDYKNQKLRWTVRTLSYPMDLVWTIIVRDVDHTSRRSVRMIS